MSNELTPVSLSIDEKRAVLGYRRAVGLFGHLGTVSLGIGAICLAFGTSHRWLFWTGVTLSFLGILHAVVAGPRYVKIINDHRDATARARTRALSLTRLLDSALRALMADLDVSFQRARISVYQHKQGRFVLLARVSDDLVLQRRGRGTYPDGEGVIGDAWRSGLAVVVGLPADRDEWNQRCVDLYGMPEDTAMGLSMHSRSLVATRIEIGANAAQPIGLLLLESLDARGVNGTTMDKVRDSPNYGLLSLVLEEVIMNLDEQDIIDSVV